MKKIFTLLFVIGFILSCSNGEDDELIRIESWDIQIMEKEQFDNELYARIINPDYSFSFFADFIDGDNKINGFLYSSNGNEFLYQRRFGANSNSVFVFPVSSNEISKFGYEIIINNKEVSQINLVESDGLNNSYAVLQSLYSNLSSLELENLEGKSVNKNTEDEDDLDEKTTNAIDTFRLPFINFFTDSKKVKELEESIKNIPENIKKKLGNLFDGINELKDYIKQAFVDLGNYLTRDDSDNVKQLPIDNNDVTVIEKKVEEAVKDDLFLNLKNQIHFALRNITLSFPDTMSVKVCESCSNGIDSEVYYLIEYRIECHKNNVTGTCYGENEPLGEYAFGLRARVEGGIIKDFDITLDNPLLYSIYGYTGYTQSNINRDDDYCTIDENGVSFSTWLYHYGPNGSQILIGNAVGNFSMKQ